MKAYEEALKAIRSLALLDDEISGASAIVMSRMADIYQHADSALAEHGSHWFDRLQASPEEPYAGKRYAEQNQDDHFSYDEAAKIIDPEAFLRWETGDGFDRLQVIKRMNWAREKARKIAELTRKEAAA